MKKDQKGQSMVEFAVIFPFFLFLILSIAYFSFAFADYLQLQHIARDSARMASIAAGDKNNETIRNGQYQKIIEEHRGQALISDIYQWGKDEGTYTITYQSSTNNVVVTIKAPLNKNSVLGRTVNALAPAEIDMFDIDITYTMYSESTR